MAIRLFCAVGVSVLVVLGMAVLVGPMSGHSWDGLGSRNGRGYGLMQRTRTYGNLLGMDAEALVLAVLAAFGLASGVLTILT